MKVLGYIMMFLPLVAVIILSCIMGDVGRTLIIFGVVFGIMGWFYISINLAFKGKWR
jgi:hypothetical protein